MVSFDAQCSAPAKGSGVCLRFATSGTLVGTMVPYVFSFEAGKLPINYTVHPLNCLIQAGILCGVTKMTCNMTDVPWYIFVGMATPTLYFLQQFFVRASVKKQGVQSGQTASVTENETEKLITRIGNHGNFTIDCRGVNESYFKNRTFILGNHASFNCYYFDKNWADPHIQASGNHTNVNITLYGPGWSFKSQVLMCAFMGLLFYHRNTVYDRLVASL